LRRTTRPFAAINHLAFTCQNESGSSFPSAGAWGPDLGRISGEMIASTTT